MRKLIESTFLTLDGVVSDPQNYGAPYWDEEHTAYATKLMEGADALLLGRETFEHFAAAWPQRSGDPYTDKINAMPKYVASRTLSGDLAWEGQALTGDVAEAVTALKEQDGGDLLKFGTGELDRVLLENKLVDEYHLWIFPVFAGKGDRIFDGFDLTHLELKGTTPMKSGIVVHTYGPK